MSINLNLVNEKEHGEEHIYVHTVITKDGAPGVVFLSSTNLVNTYYLEAVSMVGFLMEKYGGERFAVFCRELRDGASLEDALRSAYSTIHTIKDFEDRWKEYLNEGY